MIAVNIYKQTLYFGTERHLADKLRDTPDALIGRSCSTSRLQYGVLYFVIKYTMW